MHKYIRNGKVAVVLSMDYGSGWSTWAPHEEQLQVLFDPVMVEYILNNNFQHLEEYVALRYPDRSQYRVTNLGVRWVTLGEEFIIREYDGQESIELKKDIKWITA